MFTSVDKQCNKTHNIVCLNVGLQCLAREVGAVTSYDGSCPTSARGSERIVERITHSRNAIIRSYLHPSYFLVRNVHH